MAEIHRIQEAIYEETKRMSVKERVAYYRHAKKEFALAIARRKRTKRTA
jgi:hypothetical protein